MYLEPTNENAISFLSRGIQGPVVMLNLLRLREVADYSATPELAPPEPISGEAAYKEYVAHTVPFETTAGGEVLLVTAGPSSSVPSTSAGTRRSSSGASVDVLLGMAQNQAYGVGLGHRTAALEDSPHQVGEVGEEFISQPGWEQVHRRVERRHILGQSRTGQPHQRGERSEHFHR